MTAPPTADGRGPRPSLVTTYRRLSALASSPGTTPATVTAALVAATGVRVALVGPQLRVLAASAPGVDDAEAAVAVRERVRGPRPAPWARIPGAPGVPARVLRVPGPDGSLAVLAPVLLADEVHSFLVGEYEPGAGDPAGDDDAVLLATEHAATVIGVLVGRDRVLTAAAGQVRADLVSGLLLGRARDADQAARWAEHLGHEAGSPHRVVIVAPLDASGEGNGVGAGPYAERHALLAEAEEHLLRDAPAALTVVRDTEVAAVVPSEADPVGVGSSCARRLARGRVPDPDAHWPVTVAVGGEVSDPAALATSYDQARRTLVAARRLGGTGRVLRFDDLGIHRLLLQIPDPASARDFAREVLGRLVDGHSERATDVLHTLARWFREDGSLQRTARALSVHPNTVTYRLRRAEELSGLSLDRYGDRLAAQVALEILGEMAG